MANYRHLIFKASKGFAFPAMLLMSILLSMTMNTAIGQSQLDLTRLINTLDSPDRDIADRIRDEQRKPAQVLEFLQLEPGMTALDIYAAGGYFTYVLSKAVGPEGTVLAQNSPRALRFDEDRSDITQGDALAQKITSGGLDNVTRIDRPVDDMSLPPDSVDFILLSQILHDYYNSSPQRASKLLETLYQVLRPGGILGVIDHHGDIELNNRRLHRMPSDTAISVVNDAGFMLEAGSDLLEVQTDNPRRSIFDPMLNRQTSQFLLRFKKPTIHQNE